jgi:aspartate ammonia-lyase
MERDSLGEVRVARDALWGARTERAAAVLGVSDRGLFHAPALYCALGEVKAAAAMANHAAGLLPDAIAEAICEAARALSEGELEPELIADLLAGGGSIALHVNVSEVIANAANERLGSVRGAYAPVDPSRHVNASQSTADVCHTAARIAVLRETTALGEVLERLAAGL